MKTEPKNNGMIICGTDFSEPATQAANVAAVLAGRLKETLLLVHAVENLGLEAITPKVMESLSASIASHLGEEADRLRRLGAVVKAELVTAPPDEALVKLARSRAARLVVVSSLGRRAPGRWLLGSISERTAERAAVPTLVVRDAAPFEAWARGERALKVFVAADFTIPAEAALRWVADLKKIGPCDVIVGHVNWPPAEQARLGLRGPLPLTENSPQAQHVLERDLGAKVGEILGAGAARVRVAPNWGRTDAALVEMALEEKADLIVTGTHQHHGLERLASPSVSRGLLHLAPMSVACVPTPDAVAHGVGALPRLKHVLAATDFSALGDRAIRYAYATLPPGSVVKLIHVIPSWELPGPLVPHYQPKRLTKKQHKQLTVDLLKKLRALIPAEAETLGILTEVEIVEGRAPDKAICQAAEQFGADVICMGTHGRTGLKRGLIGSVAEEVTRHAPCPVLVVR